jgi:hypothetical protein
MKRSTVNQYVFEKDYKIHWDDCAAVLWTKVNITYEIYRCCTHAYDREPHQPHMYTLASFVTFTRV